VISPFKHILVTALSVLIWNREKQIKTTNWIL